MVDLGKHGDLTVLAVAVVDGREDFRKLRSESGAETIKRRLAAICLKWNTTLRGMSSES